MTVLLLGASGCRPTDRTDYTPEIITTKFGIEMVRIPGGRFTMGRDDGEADQRPAHQVYVDAFWMDRCEITQEMYAHYEPINGSHFKGPNRPTEMISWDRAALFCNWRSRQEGFTPCYDEQTGECNFQADGYRLPTEAEWEYACRAGGRAEYSFGNDARRLKQHAWFAGNAGKITHPAAKKEPNAWGLFDMHGNVVEWCNDRFDKDYYQSSPEKNPRGPAEGERFVLRGGAWNSRAEACGSAVRASEEPGFSDACFARDAIGFRCVRKASPKDPPAK